MTYGCSSGNFSSRSFGSYLQYPRFSCGSSYPSNLVYSTDLQSPINYQLGSSLFSGCQENFCEPSSCQRSCVVSSPCQTSCYRYRRSPCRKIYSRSLGFGSSSCHSLGSRSRSCYSSGCGSSGFGSVGYGVRAFPSLGYGSGFCRPNFLTSRTFQSPCYRPTCGSGFYGFTC
ncbi:PREDICTED: keratin-associated protein 13-1-like [Chinchilla lanigera]|uniref:keratin-associated protein 13-1-like n=1 Tax=Chinchilla lanigera TaxID=34839 RepID=UPI00038ECE50|nr:PREDICTED: keratin-associated protein 13-1-like [Chinchilla lanigera]